MTPESAIIKRERGKVKPRMKKETRYIVFHPSGGVYRFFPSYREAWEFVEAQFAAGKGVYTIEQVN